MQVDLIKAFREPAYSISPCRRAKLCTFFEQAGLALCCEPREGCPRSGGRPTSSYPDTEGAVELGTSVKRHDRHAQPGARRTRASSRLARCDRRIGSEVEGVAVHGGRAGAVPSVIVSG